MRYLLILAISLSFAFLFTGCSSSEKIDTSTAEGAFTLAQKYETEERFEEAVTYYGEVKNKYPYSRYALESELKIADIEFKRENFAEAESAYKLFREFHPAHPQTDYVTFRLGLSIFNQLPTTVDRDLALAKNAVEQFDSVLSSHASSTYAPEAQAYRKKALQMLADKAHYIAEFYFIREKWESALARYEDILQSHPGFGYDLKALYGATLASYKFKDMDKSKIYFKRLLTEYPDSAELASARKDLADGF